MKASEFIKDIDIEVYDFLNEVLEPYEDLPKQFYDKNFIPSYGDIKLLSNEQLNYLVECYNEDASDAIAEGDEAFRRMNYRNLVAKYLVALEIGNREVQITK